MCQHVNEDSGGREVPGDHRDAFRPSESQGEQWSEVLTLEVAGDAHSRFQPGVAVDEVLWRKDPLGERFEQLDVHWAINREISHLLKKKPLSRVSGGAHLLLQLDLAKL